MEKDIREKIALKRYQIISPVLAEPARAQNDYFRRQAEKEHDFYRGSPLEGRLTVALPAAEIFPSWFSTNTSHSTRFSPPSTDVLKTRPLQISTSPGTSIFLC